MPNSPFNSKYGFDLGNITDINVVGVAAGSTNKVLVLRPDGTGKFILTPESLSATTGSSTTFTPTSGSSYMKKEVFSGTTTTTTQTTLKTFDFDIGASKTKLYLTMKLDLMGQSSTGISNDYYHFTTGYNLISDNTADGTYYYRHIPGHFSYILNKNGSTNGTTLHAVGPDKQFQNFSDLPTISALRLQPKFSTLSTQLTDTSVITTPANIPYPIITHSINSSTNGTADDKLRLTLNARSISSGQTINWFGSVEFIASIT